MEVANWLGGESCGHSFCCYVLDGASAAELCVEAVRRSHRELIESHFVLEMNPDGCKVLILVTKCISSNIYSSIFSGIFSWSTRAILDKAGVRATFISRSQRLTGAESKAVLTEELLVLKLGLQLLLHRLVFLFEDNTLVA